MERIYEKGDAICLMTVFSIEVFGIEIPTKFLILGHVSDVDYEKETLDYAYTKKALEMAMCFN